ncbi:CotH kinase family protein [Ruminococcus flavefaciens]|uniref:CotH kinase family protein n=1 Tax=Ruminococcus flavefaciens TaxID=1265 RepID=UPI003F024F6C
MKRIISVICAMVAVLYTSCFMPHLKSAFSAEESSIIEEQLDMPIISIDTLGKKINDKSQYAPSKVTIWDKNGELEIPETEVKIRLRGNSTLHCEKKSYKFKFDKKQNPLGIGNGSGKGWNLLANYFDTSLLRNMTAYHLGDMLDNMPYSVNCRSVEVYVNGSYQGVYLLCEDINVNKNRLAITEKPELVEGNGYLLEMTRTCTNEHFEVDNAYYDIKSKLSDDYPTALMQKEYISNYIAKSLNVLRRQDKARAEELIDIPSLADNFIANELCKNNDIGWGSFYLCKDAGGKLVFAPMWDYDLALENFDVYKGFDSPYGINEFDVTASNSNSNQWYCYALQNDWFREAVAARWKEVSERVKTLPDYVREEAKTNMRSYMRNFEMWEPLGKEYFFETDSIAKFTEYQEHIDYLSEWITKRIQWLDGYFCSEDFKKGVFLDENNKPVDTENAFAATKIIYGDIPSSFDYYNIGYDIEANKWNRLTFQRFWFRAGHRYRLSFDISGDPTAELNYKIKSERSEFDIDIKDTVHVTEETTHYEKEFESYSTYYSYYFEITFDGSGKVNIGNLSLVDITPGELVIQGDVNDDGQYDLSDFVLFQKWLLGSSTARLDNWEAADLCKDNRLDVFDLCLMRRRLIG